VKTSNEIRLAAADLLESRPNAWIQGEFRRKNDDGTYSYCMVGACREVAGYYAYATYSDDDAANAAADAAASAANADAVSAVSYNDAPGRTREGVITALRAI